MSSDNIVFANLENVKEIIAALYPDAQNITFIEHGYDNLVALVDETYAVRFPRNKHAYARSQYEKELLKSLEQVTSVAVPKLLGEKENPPYLITSFLKGEHLSPNQVNEFSLEQQKEFAKKVATFAYEMHSILSVDEARHSREKLKLDETEEEPWSIYFEKMLLHNTFPTPDQDKLAKQYYKRWKGLKIASPEVVVHDDIHTENLLFEDQQLIGVLDFGDTNIGTAEQELRQLYRVNEMVLWTAVETYNYLSGQKLNMQAIITWAITQELGVYADRLQKNDTTHSNFVRACSSLNNWLPEGAWSRELPTDSNVRMLY